MSEKASGNTDSAAPTGPEGAEWEIDPDSGDQLDPVERWWDEPVEPATAEEPVQAEELDVLGFPPKREKQRPVALELPPIGEEAPEPAISTKSETADEEPSEESGAEAELEKESSAPPPLLAPADENTCDEGKKSDQEEGASRPDLEVPKKTRARPPLLLPEREETEDSPGLDSEHEEEERKPLVADAPEEDEAEEEGKESHDSGDDEEEKAEDDSDEDDPLSDKDTRGKDASGPNKPVSDENPEKESVPGKKSSKKEKAAVSGEKETAEAVVAPAAAPRAKAGCWTVFTTFFFFASLLLVLLLLGAGAFAWSRLGDAEKEIRSLAEKQLGERGIHLDYGDVEYRFPRGFVLQDVTIFADEAKQTPRLAASDIGVNVDLAALIQDRTSVSSAEISFEGSSLSFYHEGETVATLQGIDAEVLVEGDELRIERFEGEVGGLLVSARGSLGMDNAKPGEAVASGDDSPVAAEEAASPPIDFSILEKLSPWLDFESEGDLPTLFVELSGDASAWSAKVRFDGAGFTWRGLPVTTASATANYANGSQKVEIPAFQIGHGEGFMGGVVTLDLEAGRADLTRIQSTVDPLAFAAALRPEWGEKFASIRLLDAPTIQVTGSVPFAEPANAVLDLAYEHRMGFVVSGKERELPVSDARGTLRYSQGGLETNDLAATVLGGTVQLNGATRITAEDTPFSGLVEIVKMPLSEVAAHYGKEDLGMTGDLYLDFRGVGYSDVARIRGGGNVRIVDAKLPSFPATGPVQQLIGSIVPAFAGEETGTVTGAYIVESGILVTNDFTVRQAGANLVTSGNVRLAPQTVDFTSVASLDPALAKATGLEDKKVTVKGFGPLTDPELSLQDFPIEFTSETLAEVLGTSPESLGSLGDLLGEDLEEAAEILGAELGEEVDEETVTKVKALIQGFLGPADEEGDEKDDAPKPPVAVPVE